MKNEDNTLPKNYSVPLLISSDFDNRSNIFAIINDKFLFNNRPWNVIHKIQGAFNSLLWLYTNFEEDFPVECRRFFQGEKQQKIINGIRKNTQNKKPNVYSLLELWAGVENQYFQYSLEMNIRNEQPIQMKNWTHFVIEINQGFREPIIEEVILLDHCLEMTPKQAFLLFANNCIAYFDYKLLASLEALDSPDFEEIDDIASKLDEYEINSFHFVREYLSWLKRELNRNLIQPLEILRYNGYRTIPYLSKKREIQEITRETFQKILQFRTHQKYE